MRLRPLPPNARSLTVAYGDGVGPEIMEAALNVMREADVMLSIDTIEVGQRIYDMESPSALLPSYWEKLHRTKLLLQAPVANPEGTQSIHDELYHRMNVTEGERHTLAPGIAADVHLGEDFAFFNPAHDTQVELAGSNKANPASMIWASILLLNHIGQWQEAARIFKGLTKTLQMGEELGTREFAEAVCSNLWDTY